MRAAVAQVNLSNLPEEYVTLAEAAKFLRKSVSWAEKNWPAWERYGVKAYRPFGTLLFKKEAVMRIPEMAPVN